MRSCTILLVMTLLAPRTAVAQGIRQPLASQAVLDAALADIANQRTANLQKVRRLLAHPDSVRTVRRLADVRRVSERLSVLDDRTLERLAKDSEAAIQPAGGGPSKVLIIVLLTLIVLAIVAAALAPESS